MEPVTSLPVDQAIQPELQEYPSLMKRYQSLFIDFLFALFCMFGVVALLDKFGDIPGWVRFAAFIFLWAVYEPLCTALGCTLGNYLMGIRVRQFNNTSKRINIFQAYLRWLIKLILGWLSFLAIHSNPQKRAFHDLVAGSVMITAK